MCIPQTSKWLGTFFGSTVFWNGSALVSIKVIKISICKLNLQQLQFSLLFSFSKQYTVYLYYTRIAIAAYPMQFCSKTKRNSIWCPAQWVIFSVLLFWCISQGNFCVLKLIFDIFWKCTAFLYCVLTEIERKQAWRFSSITSLCQVSK